MENRAVDVLFVVNPSYECQWRGDYVVETWGIADEKELSRKLKSAKKARSCTLYRNGETVPAIKRFLTYGKSGAFSHFVGRHPGDFIQEYLQLKIEV